MKSVNSVKKKQKKNKLFYMSRGNHKLSKEQLIWNLPRGKTCPGAGDCLKWCYEIKTERIYRNARLSRERNLLFSKSDMFMSTLIEYLRKSKKKIVRIHSSGDFYSQVYLDKWKAIARTLKDTTFYAFTKSFHLDLYSNLSSNFIILQSTASKWDKKIDWSKNTAITYDLERHAELLKRISSLGKVQHLCPYHDPSFENCGTTCNYCFSRLPKEKHVIFILH